PSYLPRSSSMGGRLCQRGGLVIPRTEGGSVASSPFRERAAVLQAQPFDVGARSLPGVRTARLTLQGTFCIAPFGQDHMRLPGEQLARAVRHLCDRLDDVCLLARRVEDLAGKRFHSPRQADLCCRTRLELTLRPLEFLELRQ